MGYHKLTPIIAKGATEPRYLEDRFNDAINPKDFGAVGNGLADDTDAVESAATYAVSIDKPLYMPDIYCVSELVLPSNIKIVNTATFVDKGDGPASSYVITFSENSTMDSIVLKMVENTNYRYGIRLEDNCSVQHIKVYAESERCNSEAVCFAGDNIYCGFLETSMITRGGNIGAYHDIVYTNNVSTGRTADNRTHYTNITLNGYFLDGVTQGLRIGRAKYCNIGKGTIKGLPDSVEWTPRPGYNGLYVTASDHISFGDVLLDRILEHGIRLAGDDHYNSDNLEYSFTAHDIHFNKIVSYRHGGSAVKINPGPKNPNYNITINSITSVDAGKRPRANTRRLSALRLSHCNHVSVGDVVSVQTDPSVQPIQDSFFETDNIEIVNAQHVAINRVSVDVGTRSIICFNENNDGDGEIPASTYKCEHITIGSIVCQNAWGPYYCVKGYVTAMKIADVRLLNVACFSDHFSGYLRGADTFWQNTELVKNFNLFIHDVTGKAFAADSLSTEIIVNSLSFGEQGQTILHAKGNADYSSAYASAGVLVKTNGLSIDSEEEQPEGPGASLVFVRRTSPSRPAGAIGSYQFAGSTGKSGLVFATGDGTTSTNTLYPRWFITYQKGGAFVPAQDNTTDIGGTNRYIKTFYCNTALTKQITITNDNPRLDYSASGESQLVLNVAEGSQDFTVGTGPAICFNRRNSNTRPSGAICAYQFAEGSSYGGKSGLGFLTCDGTTASSALTLRWLMSWENGGALLPAEDNVTSIGDGSTHRLAHIYCSTGAVETSDKREKSFIQDPDTDLLSAWENIEFKLFKFNSSIEEKGENARIHAGIIAQDVKDAFSLAGLNAEQYGLFCHDEWESSTQEKLVVDKPAVIDENGNVIEEEISHKEIITIPAGDRYGIRYGEALVIEAAYQRRRADRLEARIAALEECINQLLNPNK